MEEAFLKKMIRAYYCIVARAVRKNRLDDYFVIYLLEGEIGNLNHAKSGIEMKIFTDQPWSSCFYSTSF
jgi:hypothetical protein